MIAGMTVACLIMNRCFWLFKFIVPYFLASTFYFFLIFILDN